MNFTSTNWQHSANFPGTCAHCANPLGMHRVHDNACPARRLTKSEKHAARDGRYAPTKGAR